MRRCSAAIRRIQRSDLIIFCLYRRVVLSYPVTMGTRRLAGAVLGALAVLLPAAAVATDDAPFTENEVRAILAHGPWPAPATQDPSNRVSGNRAAIELGERLFFDARM